MLKKLLGFKRTDFSIGCRIIYIYLKKMVGLSITKSDLSYLLYFNFLAIYDFTHQSEDKDSFTISTKSGIDLTMRKHPSSDAQVLKQIWIDEEYRTVVDILKSKISSKELKIIDAGANVGFSSVFLFQELKDKFQIDLVCIEPDEHNIAQIIKNFELNQVKNFQIEKAGLFNKNCYLRVLNDFRDGKEWSLRVEEVIDPSDLSSVELQSILDKMNWPFVDFCKIDIEGAERYLFDNEIYASLFLKRIKIISLEIHTELNMEDRITAILRNCKFEIFSSGEITIGINSTLV